MSKAILFAISANFIQFEWDGKTLTWKGQSQKRIDFASENPEMRIVEYSKKQVDERLSGEAKEEFLEAYYEVKTAMELVEELDKLLYDAKKGK
jgi:hypothetical protein